LRRRPARLELRTIRASPCTRHQCAELAFRDIGELAGIVTCDVSFISVTLILPAAVPLFA